MKYYIVIKKSNEFTIHTSYPQKYLDFLLSTGELSCDYHISIDADLQKIHGVHLCDCTECYIIELDEKQNEKKFYCEDLKKDVIYFEGICDNA